MWSWRSCKSDHGSLTQRGSHRRRPRGRVLALACARLLGMCLWKCLWKQHTRARVRWGER
jgi:hypothetical protein